MMPPIKILLIEDDPNLGFILHENLEMQGYSATLCAGGEEGKKAYLQGNFDLCLIDVMLPKRDGFTLAAEIRKLDQDIPIIFLTAKSLKEDRIQGLKIGGDDYVTKPFSMEELLLRIQAVLKRYKGQSYSAEATRIFAIGEYEFDYDHQLLKVGDQSQKLTFKEAELLKLLCLHQNQILERELALNLIWGDDSFFNARSMDVFISRLRKYLKKDERVKIVNVHGKGFKLVVN
ncbi:MAG: response regulator transcription factor [bacterium]